MGCPLKSFFLLRWQESRLGTREPVTSKSPSPAHYPWSTWVSCATQSPGGFISDVEESCSPLQQSGYLRVKFCRTTAWSFRRSIRSRPCILGSKTKYGVLRSTPSTYPAGKSTLHASQKWVPRDFLVSSFFSPSRTSQLLMLWQVSLISKVEPCLAMGDPSAGP